MRKSKYSPLRSDLLFRCLCALLLAGCGRDVAEITPTPVPQYPPEVSITSLANGDVLYPGDHPWEFRGLVSDVDSPDIALLDVTWQLLRGNEEVINQIAMPDEDGAVTLRVNYLEEDDYLLRLEATDVLDLRGLAEVTFSVRNVIPVVQFLDPDDGAQVDQWRTIPVVVQVTDPDNPSDQPFLVSLSTDPEGETQSVLTDAEGLATFQYTPHSSGSATLRASALDELSALGTDEISVEVNECLDTDGDGYATCPAEGLEVDCNDADASVYPGASERCNKRDDDCDGLVPSDEFDMDGDGVTGCQSDCDDSDPATYAGAREACDGLDNNCDDAVPENEGDRDGDGYRACGSSTREADCDDTQWAVHPDAEEQCNGVDDDCDGALPPDEGDLDGDGWLSCEGDCDDTNYYTFPGAIERLDLKDNNCDGKVEGVLSLSSAQARYDGLVAEAQTGSALAAGGDINGDGVADLLIGAPRYDSPGTTGVYKGGVFVVLGRTSGWRSQEGASLSSAFVLAGVESSGKIGAAVRITRDMNGDRIDDLMIGAPGHTVASFTEAGAAYLVTGRNEWCDGDVPSMALTVVEGTSASMNLGAALSSAGDIDCDGMTDVAIGAPWTSKRPAAPGVVVVLPGHYVGWSPRTSMASLLRISGTGNSAIGVSLASGYSSGKKDCSDLLVGGWGDTTDRQGVVYWLQGSTAVKQGSQTTMDELGAPAYEGEPSSRAGSSVSTGVDVDGDARDDVLVGRQENSGLEDDAAYLIFGRSLFPESGQLADVADVRFLRSDADKCPCTVAGIGDWNGDGLGDFAIGVAAADGSATSSGRVYLFLGRRGQTQWPETVALETADGILEGEAAGDQAGLALAGGDLNGDGIADLVIGAPSATVQTSPSSDISRAGKVYVVLGSRS